MFSFRETVEGDLDRSSVEIAFTDAAVDLQSEKPGFEAALARVEAACAVPFVRLHQVHGDDVHLVIDQPPTGSGGRAIEADAMVTTRKGLGLMIRVADCAPVLLVDTKAGVIGAAHAGRPGLVLDVVTRTVERMRDLGAAEITAWVGPHVCGACYEVPAPMRDVVAAAVPESYAQTRAGTPSVDIGAGVAAQLGRAGVPVVAVGSCTLEHTRHHSYRRDGDAAGRQAGLVWMR